MRLTDDRRYSMEAVADRLVASLSTADQSDESTQD